VSVCGSSSAPDDPNPTGPEAQGLCLAADLQTAFSSCFVSGYDFARNIGVVVGADDFPTPLIFGAVPRFELHCANPVKVQARFARVASAVAGATTVSTSPAVKIVAELMVNIAMAADAANVIVPTMVPFFWILNVLNALAADSAVPRLPEKPAGKVAGAANT
jgi:hypothetical protein